MFDLRHKPGCGIGIIVTLSQGNESVAKSESQDKSSREIRVVEADACGSNWRNLGWSQPGSKLFSWPGTSLQASLENPKAKHQRNISQRTGQNE